MLETVIVAALLSLVLGFPLMIFRSAERMRSSVTTRGELQAQVRLTLDRLTSRLELASAARVQLYAWN